MLRAAGAKRRRAAVVLVLAVATVIGCGDDFANDARAAPESSVSAVVTVKGVTVSPPRLRAGMIELIASNQSPTSQRVQLRSLWLAHGAKPLAQSTGPINPGGAASLKASLAEGTYAVSARGTDLEPATIVVEPASGSGSDRLLQP